MESTQQLQIGQTVGACRIIRKIGEGGMGEVYEAWEEGLQRKVAIKILSQSALASDQMVERFRGEGRALAKVNHRNVVSLFSIGEMNGRAYMAMEYVDGLPVHKFFETHPCALKDILEMFQQMAEGLACAHEANVIHRDIKPANIIIDRTLTCKIIDFGIAKVHSDHQTVHTAQDIVMGTANYLSPEVVMGRLSTHLSDIYSLGLVFYSVLTGDIPFPGHSNLETLEKIRSSTLAFNPRFNVIIPEEIKQIIFRMTSKSPNMRYRNAQEVVAELKKISLENWPADLLIPVFPRLVLENRPEVQALCEKHGFGTPETRLIINLAVSLTEPGDPTKTEVIDTAPIIRLQAPKISEAIQRFNSAKSELVERRAEIARRPPPVNNSRQKFIWPALGCLVALSVVYFSHAIKTPSPTVVTAPPLRKTELSSSAPATNVNAPTKPEYKMGDHYQTSSVAIENGVLRLGNYADLKYKSSGGGKTTWSDPEGGELVRDDEFYFPPYSVVGRVHRHDFTNELVGPPKSLFPLISGNISVNKFIYKTAGQAKPVEYTRTCIVDGKMRTESKAGIFETYKIVCNADGGPTVTDIYYYAPSVRSWVRREVDLSEGARHVVHQLVGYQLGQ
ncbi:MAG: serine/threonine protein kinase [Bdellovibrionales bacterium]